jgi:bacterioferritin (cytochrome b1)
MHSNNQSEVNQTDVDQLNSFLRGELAAVETYDQALSKIDDRQLKKPLREVRASHDRRAYLIRQRILVLGGEPAASSGMWGGIAKLVEAGAAAFGVSPAIAALEEGEDRGRDGYRKELDDLSPETQAFVSDTVLPEQLRTHDMVSALKREIKGRSSVS